MTANFTLNFAGITELMHQPEMVAQLEEHARRVEETARMIAPRKTGEYADSIESGSFDDGDRVTAYVAAKVPYAIDVEVRHRTLGTALGISELE